MARDSKSYTEALGSQIEQDVEPFDDSTKIKVRRLIAGNALGEKLEDQVADAEELMKILGVHPSQDDDTPYLSSSHDPHTIMGMG